MEFPITTILFLIWNFRPVEASVPSIAQLVERRTVGLKSIDILRSLVRIRLEGDIIFFSEERNRFTFKMHFWPSKGYKTASINYLPFRNFVFHYVTYYCQFHIVK